MPNIPLTERVLSEAKSADIDVSQAAEAGLVGAMADRHAERWLKENAETIESYNAYVEQHGLPLEKYRRF
jgi:antitoxin CcdA